MIREGDYIQQLANYIQRNLAKGYTLDSLRVALEAQDYSRTAIESAIQLANEQLASRAPIMKEKPVIRYQAEPSGPYFEEKKSFWQRIKSWLE